jgi:SAM-dependent methyltransferase
MRPLNYEVMFEVEDDHWWFVGRRALVFAQIEDALKKTNSNHEDQGRQGESVSPDSPRDPRDLRGFIGSKKKQILDIGCGTGATMDHLKRYGEVNGIDLSELPLQFSRRRGHQRVMRASATELPFPDRSFDLITALDVVEHLDDDAQGLSEIRRVLKPGAPAVIFVPAFQALWGPNDDQSGHKRRYRIDQLRRASESAGLVVERISYANIAMFIPIWLGRKLLTLLRKEEQAENRINHPMINKFLARIFSSEAGWLRKHRLPFGVSIICVVRRLPADHAD